MTQSSKLKQRIRTRMARTGESYATARRHILSEVDARREKSTRVAAQQARSGPATGTVSEERCIEKTGHGFEHWFALLDRFGARDKGHKAAARHLLDEHGVSAWYAQAITVSYERARGLRVVGQSCAGDFQVSVSRVVSASVEDATRSISHLAKRERWLTDPASEPGASLGEALKAKRFRSADGFNHLRYKAGDATIDLRITAKADGRSTVGVQVSRLTGTAEVEAHRAAWRDTLDRLRDHLR